MHSQKRNRPFFCDLDSTCMFFFFEASKKASNFHCFPLKSRSNNTWFIFGEKASKKSLIFQTQKPRNPRKKPRKKRLILKHIDNYTLQGAPKQARDMNQLGWVTVLLQIERFCLQLLITYFSNLCQRILITRSEKQPAKWLNQLIVWATKASQFSV